MKKLLLTMLGVLLALPVVVAREFTYEYEGQTITYTVLDEEAKTVEVKENNYNNPFYVSGVLTLPAHPKEIYTLISISTDAFYGCTDLTSVIIPNTVKGIGYQAFASCKNITSVMIPNSVSYIGPEAFCDCSHLTSIEIPNSVTSIEMGTFIRCNSLSTVVIPNTVTYIDALAFEDCNSLTYIDIPNSVTYIGIGSFENCRHLTSIEIPNSVTSIGDWAFSGCENLTSVEIPNILANIGNEVFKNCNSLISIYYNTMVPVEANLNLFTNKTYINATLYVPEEAVETFRQTQPWKNFRNIQGYNFSSGVEDVTAGFDKTLPCEYFNLSGVKGGNTKESLAPGIYIMRQGNASKKIVVK